MGDIFDQVATAPAATKGDIFDQVSPAPSPTAPGMDALMLSQRTQQMNRMKAAVQPESVTGFINRITGMPGYHHQQVMPQDLPIGAAKDIATLTKAGPQAIAPSIFGKPDVEQVIRAGVGVGTAMALGGIEGEGTAPTPELNRSLTPKLTAPSSSPTIGSILARKIPIVGRVLRNIDDIQQLHDAIVGKQEPAAVSNKFGTPPELWGKMVEQAKGELGANADITRINERAAEFHQQATAQEPYQVVKVGNLPKAKGDPYAGARTPQAMTPAQSTTISLHGYHPESQTMVVQFKNGNVYEYRGVPQEVFDAYKNSESQGSFFANNIKGRYETNLRGQVKPTTSAGAKVKQALGGQPSNQ